MEVVRYRHSQPVEGPTDGSADFFGQLPTHPLVGIKEKTQSLVAVSSPTLPIPPNPPDCSKLTMTTRAPASERISN